MSGIEEKRIKQIFNKIKKTLPQIKENYTYAVRNRIHLFIVYKKLILALNLGNTLK